MERLIQRGKVRDVYAWHDDLLLVASDRISAFDVILPSLVPDKGKVLTRISQFWFEKFHGIVPNHVRGFELPPGCARMEWKGRVTWCRRAEVIPMECVVRGYLAGSAWQDYQKTGQVQGKILPSGLVEASPLDQPLFTPTTKATAGHDRPLTEQEGWAHVGKDLYQQLERLSLTLFELGSAYARQRGLLLADTKFEFGWIQGELALIDECLTPDSSRFWPADSFQPGKTPPGYDKQLVRDYLAGLKTWNRQAPGPVLPDSIVQQTRQRYFELCEKLTGALPPTGENES